MAKTHKKDRRKSVWAPTPSNKGKKHPRHTVPEKGPTDFDAIADQIIEIHKETIKELEKY